MSEFRAKIAEAIQTLHDTDGMIPDLLDQCGRLNELADELDAIRALSVSELLDASIRIADRIREQVESIKIEMGQS